MDKCSPLLHLGLTFRDAATQLKTNEVLKMTFDAFVDLVAKLIFKMN